MASLPKKSLFSEEEQEELKKMFHDHDENSDGRIDHKELLKLIESTGEDVTSDEVEEAIKTVDTNGDAALNLEEFLALMTQLRSLD
ncbi:hypothetical protein BGZ68_007852 [Mortierella alpina]|nr:hypothetical protein BGZ68_007852 [Mortierella alpina]